MMPSQETARPIVIPAPFDNPGHKPRIALVRGLCEGSFIERYLAGAQQMAAELGIELVVFNAHGDPAHLAAAALAALDRDCAALVIDHGQADVMRPAIKAALDQGRPVVTFDLVAHDPRVPEIEQDDMFIGFILSKKLTTDYAGNANVIYINADGFAPLEKRDRIWNVFKWRHPGIKEVARMGAVTANTAADTRTRLAELLAAHPETDVVLATWDEFAHGAVQAVTQAGLAGRVKIYGVDITDQDIRAMVAPGSPWKVTVASDSYNIGRLAVRAAAALLGGETLDKYLLVEPVLITAEMLAARKVEDMVDLVAAMPGLAESPVAWFDWMSPVLARNGYRINPATLSTEQLLIQLQSTLGTLQQRNTAMLAAAEVSQAASSILDPIDVMQRAVDLICERFDLYYAGLFLIDQSGGFYHRPGEWAYLEAGTGQAGKEMTRRRHRLKLDETSMIGQAITSGRAQIALEVDETTIRYSNPLLPETRSELAVPMICRGETIGALTIQASRPGAFSQEDIIVFQTMANQLATTIENARLLKSTQEAVDTLETTLRDYTQDGWSRYLGKKE